MAIIEADAQPRTPFEQDVVATQRYFDSPRFDGIIRLYTARQVVEQRGTIPTDYTVAREAATSYEAAVDKLVDKLERQIERYRDKRVLEPRRAAQRKRDADPTGEEAAA